MVGSLRSCADRSSRTLIESNRASILGESGGCESRMERLGVSMICSGVVEEEGRNGVVEVLGGV